MLKTYKNLDFSVGGEFEPTQENFPWAKVFFNRGSINADTPSIQDVISGAIFPATYELSVFSTEVDQGPIEGTGSIAQNTSGALTIMMFSGRTTAGSDQLFRIGGSTSHHLSLFSGSGGTDFPTYHGYQASPPVDLDSTEAGENYDIGNNIASTDFGGIKASTGGLIAFNNNGADRALQDLATVGAIWIGSALENKISIAGINPGAANFSGVLWMRFAGGAPLDLDVGLQWMHEQWYSGNFVLYPPWKGLA